MPQHYLRHPTRKRYCAIVNAAGTVLHLVTVESDQSCTTGLGEIVDKGSWDELRDTVAPHRKLLPPVPTKEVPVTVIDEETGERTETTETVEDEDALEDRLYNNGTEVVVRTRKKIDAKPEGV